MSTNYLTTKQLSDRWDGSPTVGTLRNWRWKGIGPKWKMIGGHARYYIRSVEKWEKTQESAKQRRAK